MSFCTPLPKVGSPKFLEIRKNEKKRFQIWQLLLIKGVKSPRNFFWGGKFCKDQEVIQQGSGSYTTRIRRFYNKDQEVIQQGSGGYKQDFFGIGATILIGGKMLCLPYAWFL